MPFCEPCEQYWAPTALTVEGKCPTCGCDVGAHQPTDHDADESTPWHFKLLVVMLVAYLGWRLLELFGIL
ncbi:MAG TPA: hypothetical protein VNQ73_16735 [Ilumatobacter sp.]|nr:hypothetical protein [Ilumatobacter sp.]